MPSDLFVPLPNGLLQEMSFCVVAYTSQLLNSVLVVLLVNARPNAQSTETGERIDEDDIQWLRCVCVFAPALRKVSNVSAPRGDCQMSSGILRDCSIYPDIKFASTNYSMYPS
eukprot:1140961-Pelagomonas_calceolata.AAC.2